ncbi:GntR family transcriptional regulator, partial [Streptomyces fuscigenes]|uniref:GntR family transcriptional regulator n=1 Tax=Streptomyces fuscigenes TaxID=1528880 RepID=UPI001F3114AC
MPDGATVTRHTLRQQIADALRDEILAGRLLPGREFTVRTIAEQYGVSATPVREALVDLAAQGLLDSDQHKGFRVHAFSLADFRGMVEARSLLEDGVFRKLEQTLPASGDCAATGRPAPDAHAATAAPAADRRP